MQVNCKRTMNGQQTDNRWTTDNGQRPITPFHFGTGELKRAKIQSKFPHYALILTNLACI